MESSKNLRDEWYQKNYNLINASAITNSLASKIMHRVMEVSNKSNLNSEILEVGANKGEHLDFVVDDYKSYVMTDIRRTDIPNLKRDKRHHFVIADVQNLPFKEYTFDRVISTCLLHHLDDPIQGLLEMRRVTKVGGVITILIPNDPGIMYRILRWGTTLRYAKKQGILNEAQLFHALEHRNHYLQLRSLLFEVFSPDLISSSYFPLFIESYNLNAFTVFNVTKRI
jgi:ubiquinone/menaquinone biosynthesis C-methylase UbiE